jgi:hypothetical protein
MSINKFGYSFTTDLSHEKMSLQFYQSAISKK